MPLQGIQGAAQRHSCRCMKTTALSGQAWRGYECAQSVEFESHLAKRCEVVMNFSVFSIGIS